ncbi:MAG: 3-phosphoglycerate dehydrogenase family protein [Oscillospiraceae bacterium]|nr:3-phosphoglycerate dehydrogenase family protein [Oscillospiraceae bacterium]
MFKIKTQNKITNQGLDIFDKAKYNISDGEENPDAVIVRSAVMHDMSFNENLKAIARAGAGVNNIPIEKCAEAGIVVFNTPGANANGVKELAAAALILASRDILGGVAWAKSLTSDVAKEVEKGKSQFVGHEVIGKTLGIIGMGKIGAMIANIGVALGMNAIGQDPYMTVENALSLTRSVKMARERGEIFEKSDYISLNALVTPETKNMINAESIAKMKDGVRIINMARADLVDDDAMAEALESGKVAKYVTDFPNEKVLKMKNVIAIPHLGASTEESEDNCAIMAVEQIIDYLENGNIRNSVNYPDLVTPRTTDSRLCVFHKNVSGTISKISSAVADLGMNIENCTNRSKGDYAYTVCEINGRIPEGLAGKLSDVKDIIKVNVIG